MGWEPELDPITEDTNFYAQYAENAEQIHLTVNYQYKDGSSAAQPWVAEVQAGVKCDYTVESPSIDGFEPDQKEVVFKDAYDTDQTVTVTYTGAEGRYHIEHWLLDVQGNKTGEPAETETAVGEVGNYTQAVSKEYEGFTAREISQVKIGSDGNTVVEVLYERNSYTLTWNTGEGGSYIAPSEMVYGAAVETPAKDPSRLGYDFAGWENLPATMPAQDTVVTAKWNPAQKADYKVIYWKETLTKGEYAVGEITYGKGGFVGNNIPYSTQKNYEGFKLNETKSEGNVEITPDGMAVKNVYYDRETYTIKFMRRASIFNWKEDTELRITARYGEDVSKQWEKACENDGWGPEKTGNIQYTLIANMPADNLTMYRKDPTGSEKWIYYYTEGLNGNRDVYARFKVGGNVHLTEEDKQPITGFKFNDWKKEGKGDLWLYYTRNSYKLYFENCEMDSTSIKFEAPLSKGKPQSEPGRPADVDDDYEFAGWYLDPAFENPVDWNATMPAENITIYAKWQAPEYTVSFETNGGNPIDSITVTKGEQIELPQDPEKEGDIFLGWYTDADFVKKFIPESKIVEDTTLYAKWESSETVAYTVRYVTEVNGKQKDICDPKEGTATLGTSVTEEAAAVEGYYPRSMFLTRNISKPDMVITFEYDPVQTWQYTVKYLLKDDNTSVADEETFETSNHAVAVNFKHIDGYTLVSDPVVTVTKDSAEAVFYYTTQKAIYHTQHWREGLTGEFGLYSIDTVSDEAAGKTVQAIPATYEGFTYDPDHAGTVASGTTDIQNILTMKLYYTRNQHQVKYEITGAVPDGVVLPTEGNYKYKALVNVEAPLSVPGYTFTGWTTEDVQVNNNKFMMPDKDVVLKGSFTENAEVRISYRPDVAEHGSVSLAGEDVAPATGNPAGSTATAKNGWAFKHWTKDGEIVSWDRNLSKEVIDANSKDADDLYVESKYVAVFGEDKNKDNIPDDLQIVFTYVADNNGTLKGTTSEYHNKYKVKADGTLELGSDGNPIPVEGMINPEVNVTITPSTGYKFDSWTDSSNNTYNTTDALKATPYAVKDETFTAHFTKDEFAYKVYKHYENAETVVAKEGTGTFGENILSVSGIVLADAEDYNGHHYILEKVDGTGSVITANVDSNRVDIYYVLDEKGGTDPTDPTNPDGVADKYQTVFKYVSAGNGSVTGTTYEVHTFEENGKYTEASKMPISPDAAVNIIPAEGYAFDYWTIDGSQKDYTPAMTVLKEKKYHQDTTFVVNFDADDNDDDIPDKNQVIVSYEAVNGTVTITEPVYVTLYKDGHYATPEEGGAGKLEADQIADASPLDGFDPSTEQWKANDKAAEKPTTETQITENTKYVVTFGKNGYVYDVVKRYLDVNGNLVDEIVTSATALYGENILEVSGVTVLQEEVFRDEFYELVSVDGADRLITSDLEANHVEIVYQQKEYSYDVVKRFLNAAGEEVDAVTKLGTALYGDNILEVSKVTTEQEELYKDNLYELVEIKGADLLITNDIQANHVEVIYQQKEYGYDVVKRFLNAAGEEVNAVTKLGTAAYGTNILEASDVTVLQEELHDGNLYELVKVEGADLLISNDIQANHVEIIYQQKNYNYEVVKHYEGLNETAVESTKGTAPYGTGILEMSNVDVLQHETYKEHTYVLTKVDGADKLITNDETQNRVDIYYVLDEKGGTDPTDPTNPDKPDGHPDKYQIIFRYVSADEAMGTVSVTEAEVHTFTDDAGNYVDKKEISPNGATAHALGGFAFDYWADTEGRDYTADMQNMKSQTYLEDTTFTAHFSEDKIGETDPQNPDGIPDNRQITFRYVSENPSYGTVSGTVVEVRTIMEVVEGENGYQVLETKSVNPFAEVTVSANGRYRFERWSDGTTNFANADEISAASYSADAVFTAYFNYYSGGGSGGGGGGNGGGPSGSGGDSSRGPGVTVTIDNPDVPLAPAPETGTGDVISINDGMVPMAPLPKTGQTTMRSTLLMAFSGILLAITGFSKKRKEEEN